MKQISHTFFLLLVLITSHSYAQTYHTISGYVADTETHAKLAGASIIVEGSNKGTTTDAKGFYAITLLQGEYTIICSHVGYKTIKKKILINKETNLNFELIAETVELEEVKVTYSNNMSVIEEKRFSIDKIKSIPALAGEVDVMKSFQMLPGVQTVSEGNTGLYVRGGSADQTLVYFDGATIYNPSHVYGFLSVFNPEVVKDAVLYKGHIPARYGGRLSSVMEVNTMEVSPDSLRLSGGLGIISSRLKIETPVIRDKLSLMVAGRRSYADLLTKTFAKRYANTQLFYYDLNAKLTYTLNNKNKISVSSYFGKDDIDIDTEFEVAQKWGNTAHIFQWNSLINPKLFLNFSAHFSRYFSRLDFDNNTSASFFWKSAIREYNVRANFRYSFAPNNVLTFGAENSLYKIPPGKIEYPKRNEPENEISDLDAKYAVLSSLYISNKRNLTKALSIEFGTRYSMYMNTGKSRVFLYKEDAEKADENITDTLQFNSGEVIESFHNFEPRIALDYEISSHSNLNFFYNRTAQYLQTVSNFAAGIPYERWLVADRYVKPQISNQVGIGYHQEIEKISAFASVELYHRWFKNQIDLKNDATILQKNNLETEILAGDAVAYGAEFLIEKQGKRWNGWLSYTWSKVLRQIAGINSNRSYHPSFDRRHNLSLFSSYAINDRLTVACNWVYASGQAITFPEGVTEIEGIKMLYYNEKMRNQHRMPDYHRLDLSLRIDGKNNKSKRWKSQWDISFYNVYARKNAYFISFSHAVPDSKLLTEIDTNDRIVEKEYKPLKSYLFSIVPSITYNFKF